MGWSKLGIAGRFLEILKGRVKLAYTLISKSPAVVETTIGIQPDRFIIVANGLSILTMFEFFKATLSECLGNPRRVAGETSAILVSDVLGVKVIVELTPSSDIGGYSDATV